MTSANPHTWPSAIAPSPRRTTSGDLAAIAMHFNPCGYQAPRDNFIRFREHFHGCPLFTCEVSFDGKFHLGADWRIHATPANLMWQKEQLVNWMVARLPSAFRKVAWIDADLLFFNPDWSAEASALLDRFPLVQLYSGIHYLNPAGQVERTLKSWAQSRARSGTPGGAWAARRELLATHGLYQFNVCGGGDSLFVDAIEGKERGVVTERSPESLNRHSAEWIRRFHQATRGEVGCVAGDVVHLHHGSMSNRAYVRRYQVLTDHAFDPAADVRIGWNGLLEWCSHKPAMHEQMEQYFLGRQEDAE